LHIVAPRASHASGQFDLRLDCDLTNPLANGGCGPMAAATFGTGILTTRYDTDFLRGWGKRPYDWEIQGGIQHELSSGLSANVTYTRHWWGNFLARKNLAFSPSDYSPYCVAEPVDSRLPDGGGNQICGLYDINPDKFGQNDNFYTFAKNYGNQTDVYNGVDISVNARLPRSIIVQGGFSTSHEVFDSCDVVAKVDNLRTFHMGRTRLQGQFNVYNLLNVGPILGVNTTYGANWLAPTATLVGRMFKFGAQVDW
jgi:hypothetical protein